MLQGLISPESFAGNGAVELPVRERLKWQQQQQRQSATHVVGSQLSSVEFPSAPQFHGLLENVAGGRQFVRPKRHDAFPGSYELPKFAKCSVAGMDLVGGRVEFSVSDCCVEAADMAMMMMMKEEEEEEEVEGEAFGSTEEQKKNKRKTEGVGRNECKEKRIKTEVETESSFKSKSSTETPPPNTSNQNSKASQAQKPDYIHVRARRGQATDSHSLAERARREKISKKMKCLQDLVPGCNKITGKAGMLDEIINYVQSLQRQVEFLSMKLAALNSSVELNIDNLSAKEFPAYVANFPAAANSSATANSGCLPFNPSPRGTANCMLDVSTSSISAQTTLHESTSSSVSLLKLCPDSLSKICQNQSFSTWDNLDSQALLNLYNFGFH